MQVKYFQTGRIKMHNFNAIQRSRQVTAVADDLNIASVN